MGHPGFDENLAKITAMRDWGNWEADDVAQCGCRMRQSSSGERVVNRTGDVVTMETMRVYRHYRGQP